MAKDKPQPQTGPEIEEYSTTATPKAYAGSVPVFCAHDAIVPLKDLRPNPRTRTSTRRSRSSSSPLSSERPAGAPRSPSANAAGSSPRATAASWPRSSTT